MSLTSGHSGYQSLSAIEDGHHVDDDAPLVLVKEPSQTSTKRLALVMVFLLTFCFYGYCVLHTLYPISPAMSLAAHRRLDEADCVKGAAAGTTGGAVAGAALGALAVGGTFVLLGLTPLGPVAGGWFAANMGAGLASGGWMALLQSAAMSGTAYGTAAATGAAAGAVATGAGAAAVYCT